MHGSSQKRNETQVVQLGSLYILLMVEREFGLKGTINFGEVTGNIGGNIMEDKRYFSKVCKGYTNVS